MSYFDTPSRASDAGPEGLRPYDDREPCQNCRELSDALLYSSSWGFLACPACVIEARAEEAMRAQEAAECAVCASGRKTVVSDRLVLGTKDSVCCEMKGVA